MPVAKTMIHMTGTMSDSAALGVLVANVEVQCAVNKNVSYTQRDLQQAGSNYDDSQHSVIVGFRYARRGSAATRTALGR